MVVYVTHYALTKGIQKYTEVSETDIKDSGELLCLRIPGHLAQYFRGRGKEWHDNLHSAMNRAEEMRVAKIASLEKQIEKIKKRKF